MARFAQAPHLYLRPAQKGQSEGIWYIKDGDKRISTKFYASQEASAQQAFANHLSKQIVSPRFAIQSPENVSISEVMILYATDCIPKQAKPEEAAQRMVKLVTYFGKEPAASITPSTCAAFVRWRCHEGAQLPHEPPLLPRAVKASTARRELEDLKAALNHAHESRKISAAIPVTLPEKAVPRERWLTRSETARLMLGALGFTLYPSSNIKTRKQGWSIWKRTRRAINRALCRFILIGLYTGTRHDAVLALSFKRHNDGGHFDLAHNLLYRAAAGSRQTKKRRPPAPIPRRLRVHLSRWQRLDAEAHQFIIRSFLNGDRPYDLNRSFRNAVERSALDPEEVTPHTLRHTCITWRMQKGIPAWKVAGFVGVTVDLIERVYGHHSPDFLKDDMDDF